MIIGFIFTNVVAGHDLKVQTVIPEELEGYNTDWMGKYRGHSKVVVKPKSTEEVSAIVKYCYEKNIAIVPQGGNTGLVGMSYIYYLCAIQNMIESFCSGGSVPVHDELIINMGNMDKIRSFDKISGIVTCDAGVILEVLDNYLANNGYTVPLDLGAKGRYVFDLCLSIYFVQFSRQLPDRWEYSD